MADEIVPEEWRPIEGWPYEVSDCGRVRRATDAFRRGRVMVLKGRVLKPISHGHGYYAINLTDNNRHKSFLIHRLVCIVFHGPAPTTKHEVAHGDGSKTNNRADNLRWATPAENSADMIQHGRSTRGKQPANTKLSPAKILEIRQLLEVGERQSAIAAQFGVEESGISSIKTGRLWAWVR